MNSNKRSSISGPVPRWLALVGVAVSLLIPFSARADHQGNDAVEILVSAAVAYAVIDAVGGFDDKDRYDRRYKRDRYRHVRHDRYDRHWNDDGHRWRHHDHRRHHKHGHGHKHRRDHDRHWSAHRGRSGHYHHRRDGRRYWCVSYH